MAYVHELFGAPGCGKTTRLMEILTDELQKVEPRRIAYVSFTRKGTYEGVERAQRLYSLKEDDLPYFRTLHSIAFRAGEYSRYDMISKSDYKEFSTAMAMKFTGYYTEEFFNNDDRYLFMHFMKRNNEAAAERYMADLNLRKLREVEYNFTRFKEFAKVHDFTDIIERFVAAGEPLPVDVAIIDEAQDLTTLQWQMCKVAFANCKRIYIAGDDDQAIYEWSGADVNFFLNINADKQEILGKSYRLQRNILNLSKSITKLIKRRVDKAFEPLGDNGNVFYHNSLDSLPLNKNETWYFLSRNNYFLSKYRDYLKREARVFVDKEGLSFDQRQIDAISVFEKARKKGKLSDVDEVKLKLHVKGTVDLSKPWYDTLNFPNDTIAYYRDLIKFKADLKDQSLTVNTIHGVKGGEADNVVVMMDFTKSVDTNMTRNPDSELRCLYVACTRAKKNLHIVHTSSRFGYDSYVRLGNAR